MAVWLATTALRQSFVVPGVEQARITGMNPMSLPPMVIVTTSVEESSAPSWPATSAVVAPWQARCRRFQPWAAAICLG